MLRSAGAHGMHGEKTETNTSNKKTRQHAATCGINTSDGTSVVIYFYSKRLHQRETHWFAAIKLFPSAFYLDIVYLFVQLQFARHLPQRQHNDKKELFARSVQRREALWAHQGLGTWRPILYLFLKFIIVYFAAIKIITWRTRHCHRRMNRIDGVAYSTHIRIYLRFVFIRLWQSSRCGAHCTLQSGRRRSSFVDHKF